MLVLLLNAIYRRYLNAALPGMAIQGQGDVTHAVDAFRAALIGN